MTLRGRAGENTGILLRRPISSHNALPDRIRYRDANGLGAEIETDQRAAGRPVGDGFNQWQDGSRHGSAYHASDERGKIAPRNARGLVVDG